jgi:uncharacterized membrane protein YphA (DoxX/SURF4 family)
MPPNSKTLTWTGGVITGLVALMLIFSATMKFLNPPDFAKEFVGRLGYPEDLAFAIGVAEVSCVLLYLIPRTAILGAVLLTGYLGGAVATHVRIHDNFAGPLIGGVLVWLGVYCRDPRIRALLPLRRSMPPAEPGK